MKIQHDPTLGLKSTWRWRVKLICACLGLALGAGLVALTIYAWIKTCGWRDVIFGVVIAAIFMWAIWGGAEISITIGNRRRRK
jgi:hypothetical protein